MTTQYEPARTPEDVARLVVERVRAKNADAVAELYEPRAVVGYPADDPAVGRDAIRALFDKLIGAGVPLEVEPPLPTLYFEDLALTATTPKDGTGGRAQVLRRQPDGSWLRVLDRPESGLAFPVGRYGQSTRTAREPPTPPCPTAAATRCTAVPRGPPF